jgi:hypothetical protein
LRDNFADVGIIAQYRYAEASERSRPQARFDMIARLRGREQTQSGPNPDEAIRLTLIVATQALLFRGGKYALDIVSSAYFPM